LTEAGGRRRKGQRLLYFFRTPPSVRVGREALDAEAMRLLEQHNPDVMFDWDRLLKSGVGSANAPVPTGAPPAASREERRRDRRDARRSRPDASPSTADSPAASSTAADEAEHTHFDSTPPPEGAPVEATGAVEPPDAFERADPESMQFDAAVESPAPAELRADPSADALPPHLARLCEEGLRRLRTRYADVVARLQLRTETAEEERAELIERAGRLNPDAWLTGEAVEQALEEYESVFESLRPFLGRPARRPRL
jgi:hypothetical protein